MTDWLELGTTLIGGLLGANANSDQTKTVSGSKEPWKPAQPYLMDNLKNNANLQKFYQQNPFNQQQKTSYENIYGDLNNFRNNTAPGLMNFANNAMTGGYQRQGGAPGAAVDSRQSSSQPASVEGLYRSVLNREPEAAGLDYWKKQFGDSIDANEINQFREAAQPEINKTGGRVQSQSPGSGLLGPFSVNKGTSYAMPDWNAQNPFSEQNKPKEEAAPTQLLQNIGSGLLSPTKNENYGNGNGAGGYNAIGDNESESGNVYGIGSSFNTDAASSAAAKAAALGLAPAAIAGLISGIKNGYMSQADIDREVAALDKALAEKDARNHGSSGGFGGSGYGGNDAHNGDSSHGTRGD